MNCQKKLRFTTLFLLCCIFLLSCDNADSKQQNPTAAQTTISPQKAIEKVIAQDETLGGIRNHACETIPLAITIQQYADGLGEIDFSNCPEEFTKAFARHRDAWVQMIPFVEKYPDLRGEMHDLFDQFEKGDEADIFKPLLKAIWDTWAEVEEAMKE